MSAGADIRAWKKKVFEVEIPKQVAVVSRIVFDQVRTRTPVKTGWARHHWRMGNTLSDDDPKGQAVDGSSHGDASPDSSINYGKSVFISNPLEYIGALDGGHSKQAGKGQMIAGAVTAAKAYMKL